MTALSPLTATACLVDPIEPNSSASAAAMNARFSNLLEYTQDLEARVVATVQEIAQLQSDVASLAERQGAAIEIRGQNDSRLASLARVSVTPDVLIGKEYCFNAMGRFFNVPSTEDSGDMDISATYGSLKFISETEALFHIGLYQAHNARVFFSADSQQLETTVTTNYDEGKFPVNEVLTTSYSIGSNNLISFPEADFEARFTGDGVFFYSVSTLESYDVTETSQTGEAEVSQVFGASCNLGDETPFL